MNYDVQNECLKLINQTENNYFVRKSEVAVKRLSGCNVTENSTNDIIDL